jgi:hypothetical protein
MLAAALKYAARGWPVFPVHTTRDGRCTCAHDDCKQVAKHPRTPRGFKDATTDAATIRAWWSAHPNANIGIPTGAVSGLVALDVDRKGGGEHAIAALEDDYSPLPDTAQDRTGGGGRHIFFKHPGVEVRNRQNPNPLRPGLDVRGDGGYVLVPPSLHASGKRYEWSDAAGGEIASLPPWLRAELVTANGTRPREAPAGKVAEGNRHGALVALAGRMRRVGSPQAEIEAALHAFNRANCNPPKSDAEIRKIAADIPKRYPAAPGNEEPQKLAGQSCADLFREEIKPMEWTIEGLLPKGLYLLADKEKGGKTYLGLQTALALAEGRGVFVNSSEFRPKNPGKTHYFDLEMDKATFKERLHLLNANPAHLHRVTRFEKLGRLTGTGIDEISDLLDREPADLIVLDTLTAATLAGAPGADRNVWRAEYEELARVRDLAHQRNITALVLHHTNRTKTPNVFDTIAGTRARVGATDGNFVIGRKRGIVTLHAEIRRAANFELAIKLWRNKVPGWHLLGDADAARRSAERDAILRLLSGGPAMGSKQIAEALEKRRGATRALLSLMARDGEVDRDAEGKYTAVLTPVEAGSAAE